MIQGTAGTTEEQIRYSWNYALLLAKGPCKEALVDSPIFRCMVAGKVVRFEEISRVPSEIQDGLITILSEKMMAVPELNFYIQAKRGFNMKYRQYFSEEFAAHYAIPDPRDGKRFLRLDELLDGGYVHEVWFFESGNVKAVPHVGSFEVVEEKPRYDEKFNRIGNQWVQSGNGGDDEQPWVGRSCRIGCVNASRGIGCFLESLAHGAAANPMRKRACILLWMSGGPAQTDTFDLKPGHKNGGPFKEIDTAVPGLRISEHLPKLAAMAKHLGVIRSMTTREGEHGRATQLLHTGQLPGGPVEYPALGSMVAKHLGDPDHDLPGYITISPSMLGGVVGAVYAAGATGYRDVLTFDMGGTSTDVALVTDGTVPSTTSSVPVMYEASSEARNSTA